MPLSCSGAFQKKLHHRARRHASVASTHPCDQELGKDLLLTEHEFCVRVVTNARSHKRVLDFVNANYRRVGLAPVSDEPKDTFSEHALTLWGERSRCISIRIPVCRAMWLLETSWIGYASRGES